MLMFSSRKSLGESNSSIFGIFTMKFSRSCNYAKKIPNEGLPINGNKCQKGDLFIRFQIKFPSYVPQPLRSKVSDVLAEVEKICENPNACD